MISSSDAEVKDGEEITKGWDKYSKPYSVAYFIVVCLFGAITGAVATALGTDLLGLYIVLLGFAAFVFLVFSNKDAKFRNLILLAFLLRMGLALFHAYVMPLPDSGADARTFERLGWQVAEAWLMGEEAPSLYGAFIYANWIGVLYFIFGRIPLVAQFTNVLLGTFTVYFTWKLALLITNSRRWGVDQRSHYCPFSDLKPLFCDHHGRKLYCFLYSYFSLLLFSVVKKEAG